MRGAWLAAGVLGAACAAGALGQAVTINTVTYYWDVNDSGSNTAAIGLGETVNLKMYAGWDPVGGPLGFAGTIYEILGLSNWDTGEVTLFYNTLDMLSDDGDLRPNNDILDIQAFQLPPYFNQYFRENNPILLYEIHWTPDDFTARTVRLTDANHLYNSFYTDVFGGSSEFQAAPSEGATIFIIPAPAGALGIAIGCLCQRRRR